ncbi:MAG: primosomal protein N' [Clostridia bacterium]|nr:primosomal protein N' [Clostridia bacterium]
MQERYVKVRLLDSPYFLDREYDYSVPEELNAQVRVGSFVIVPFGGGNRRHMALVVAETQRDPTLLATKPIRSVSTPRISLSEEMLGLVSFLREQTLCTTGDAVHAMIPSGALSGLSEQYRRTDKPVGDVRRLSSAEAFLLAHLEKVGQSGGDSLKNRFGPDTEQNLLHLCRLGLVSRELAERQAMAAKEITRFSLAIPEQTAWDLLEGRVKAPRMGEKQKTALRLLLEGEKNAEELREQGCGKAQTDALLKYGLITATVSREYRNPYAAKNISASTPETLVLNPEQQMAFDALEQMATDGAPHGVLLHGVTGSGKTCVMLRTIDGMLARGKGVIVLLPEIALTPQSLAIFCSRYGNRVAVMHSALNAGERMDAYHRILSGEADVVVGTRSAVFAPVKHLGLIVMDEEHEHTYKSDMNPKYHARDVARYRCAYHKAILLMCSATPSLESYKRATEGRYTLLTLKHRHAGAELPEVRVADMRGEAGGGNLSPLGGELTATLKEHVAAGNQAVLFLNRRGYNHVVSCRSCGQAVTCPSCSVSLTYHTKRHSWDEGYLVCHFCGRRQPLPKICPSCGSEHLARLGYGTQRVEQELGELLPNGRVLRMDTDTTSTRFSYDEMLGAFRRHEADVLLGTQMVTKGHDFPDVTLVGVLMADSSLYLDDYRASERTFSMLTQVIGRAGRSKKKGMAVIQTCNPDHDVIRLACAQDYETFYQREIKLRRLLVFPPFCDIALLTLSHKDEHELLLGAKALSDELSRRVAADYSDVKLVAFGPFEAPIYRADGQYRMRMVIKCVLSKRTRALFAEILSAFQKQGGGTPLLSVDFNPSGL